MALGYLVDPTIQVNDINGKPVANGKIYVYDADTSNLAVTYKDFEGHANTNPVLTDELGNCTIIADSSLLYDIIVNDENDELLFSKKGLSPFGSISGGSSHTVVSAGEGIVVSVRSAPGATIYDVSVDDSIVPTFDDLSAYQTQLTGGKNINISSNKINLNDTVILSSNNASATFTKNSIKIKQGNGTTNIDPAGASFVDGSGSNNIESTGVSIGTYPYAHDITYFEDKIGDYSTNTGRNQTTIQNSYGFFLNDYDNITEYGSTISATSADIVLVEKDSNGTSSYSLKDACTGTHGAVYSAGPNIDITSNVISGRDWSPELAEKLDATAFHPSDSMQAGTDLVITPLNVIKVDTNGFTSGSQNFVMNHNTSAIGDYNLVGGLNSSAVGTSNLVFGTNNKLSANESLVVGKNNTSNINGVVLGTANSAKSMDTYDNKVVMLGADNLFYEPSHYTAYSFSSIMLGYNNIDSGAYNIGANACNTIIGTNNKNIGSYCTNIIGSGNTVGTTTGFNGQQVQIYGNNNIFSGDNNYFSTIIGDNNNHGDNADYDVIIGYYNKTINSGTGIYGYKTYTLGYQNTAINTLDTFVFGSENYVGGTDYVRNTTIIGTNNKCDLSGGDVLGSIIGNSNTTQSGYYVTINGLFNTIEGVINTIVGNTNYIKTLDVEGLGDVAGYNSILGQANRISGQGDTIEGISNSCTGRCVTILGSANNLLGSWQNGIGLNNKTSANYSNTFGFYNSANSLFYSNIIGSGNNLSNWNSGCTFIGNNNDIDRGHDHFVVGSDNDFDYDTQKIKILGTNNVISAHEMSIIGDNNTANSGVGGYIFGYSNYVNKTNHPFVMGSANSAYNGNWFKTIGEQNTMSGGEDMHAFGYRNENRGYNNTYFIGHGLKATNNDGYYVGCWNAGKNGNTVFEIGYGSSNNNRKTLFLIDRNGNVSAAGSITTGVTMTANS